MRRGTQTTVKWASVNTTPPAPRNIEYTYEPAKQERVEEELDYEDDYNEDDNFVEDEAREYGRDNVEPVALRVKETFPRLAIWRP